MCQAACELKMRCSSCMQPGRLEERTGRHYRQVSFDFGNGGSAVQAYIYVVLNKQLPYQNQASQELWTHLSCLLPWQKKQFKIKLEDLSQLNAATNNMVYNSKICVIGCDYNLNTVVYKILHSRQLNFSYLTPSWLPICNKKEVTPPRSSISAFKKFHTASPPAVVGIATSKCSAVIVKVLNI